jgi:hypothetical protein
MNAPDMPAAPAPVQAVPAPQVQAPAGNDYWFLNQPMQTGSSVPQDTVTFNTQVVAPGAPSSALPVVAAAPTADEEAFIKQLKNQPVISPNMHGHLHVIQPLSAQQNGAAPQQQQMQQMQAPQQQQQYQQPMDRGQLLAQQAQMPMAAMPEPQPQVPAAPVDQAAPAAWQPQPDPSQAPAQQQVTPATDAAILDLARNDDLNVATIAREAQKRKESPDEVVISLH